MEPTQVQLSDVVESIRLTTTSTSADIAEPEPCYFCGQKTEKTLVEYSNSARGIKVTADEWGWQCTACGSQYLNPVVGSQFDTLAQLVLSRINNPNQGGLP